MKKIVFLLAPANHNEITANLAISIAEKLSDEKHWGLSAVSAAPFFRTDENVCFGDAKQTPMQFKWAAKRVVKDPRIFPIGEHLDTQVVFADNPALMEIRDGYGANEVGSQGWWAVTMKNNA